MLLAIDIGNTRIKYAVFENNTIIDNHFFLKEDFLKEIEKILKKYKNVSNLIVASGFSSCFTCSMAFVSAVSSLSAFSVAVRYSETSIP